MCFKTEDTLCVGVRQKNFNVTDRQRHSDHTMQSMTKLSMKPLQIVVLAWQTTDLRANLAFAGKGTCSRVLAMFQAGVVSCSCSIPKVWVMSTRRLEVYQGKSVF